MFHRENLAGGVGESPQAVTLENVQASETLQALEPLFERFRAFNVRHSDLRSTQSHAAPVRARFAAPASPLYVPGRIQWSSR